MGRKIVDLAGQKFGHWTVLERASNSSSNKARWLCLCKCGDQTIVTSANLRSGNTNSCIKCSNYLPSGQASFNRLLGIYKNNAKAKNLVFALAPDDFRQITSSHCTYCGIPPSQVIRNYRCNGDYLYNGVDRVDSSKNYTLDNCVPCCEDCNLGKRTKSRKDFLSWVARVHAHSSKA